MEAKTTQKYLGHSPRKMRLVADMVRRMNVDQALLTLRFTNKAAAPTLAKAIKTALANSEVPNGSMLFFKKLEINEGAKMRRYRATGGKGRARPYKKRLSQVLVVLSDQAQIQKNSARLGKSVSQKVRKSENAEKTETLSSSEGNKGNGGEKA